jgi:hypothetical protein
MFAFAKPFTNRRRQTHRDRRHVIRDLVETFGLAFFDNGLAFYIQLFGQ